MNGLLGVEHAISQGVETNGVAPAKFPGRGLGLVTDRSVKRFQWRCPSQRCWISIHGPIAAFLTRGSRTLEGIRARRRNACLVANIFEGPTPSFEAIIAFHFGRWNFMPRKPVEQMNRSIKISSLSRRGGSRMHGGISWLSSRTLLGGVSLLLAHCEHKKLFLLRPGEEPPEDWDGAVALVWQAPFTSPFHILAR
ncbi:hypothetical protein V8E54_001345 [Elaphomyces granulatus]